MKAAGLFVLIVFMTAAHIPANDKITFDDLYSVPEISEPLFSYNGKVITFTLESNNLDSNTTGSRIYFYDMENRILSDARLFNMDGDQWGWMESPDGRYISFYTETDSIDGLVVHFRHQSSFPANAFDLSGFIWSPTGDKLLGTREVYPDCLTDSCNKAREKEAEDDPIEARLYDHLLYRHYKSWDDGKVNHLFILDVNGNSRQLTFGKSSAPTGILGGGTDYAFSPDGNEVCYVMCTDTMPAISTNNDLSIIPVEGGEPNQITTNKGQDIEPRYSPDGKYISYRSQARAGYESDQQELILMNRKTGELKNLTGKFDRSVGGYKWTSDAEYIYFSAVEHGFIKIWRVNVKSGEIELILGDACYGAFDISPDGNYLAVTRSLSHQPYELYLYEINSKNLERLTFFSREMTDRLEMNQARDFWFEGFNGDSVHGWLTLPPDFDSTKKYPMTLLIHGGPQWCWLGDFNYYGWNTQLTAAQGYIVAQIDPHGSVGYGLKFKEYVSGNWGKGDYEDLMLGVDYLLQKYKFIDSTRMAALGRSYGGFMTNWICGRTDRFNCLITIDGLFDQISSYYSTEELWFPEWEFKGTPWTNPEEYRRASPSTYVENFKTPTMIIHGQLDYRVDVSEAFMMYTALQRRGVPSQLLYYPDEGHSIRKLKNLRHVCEKQFEWLDKWLNK